MRTALGNECLRHSKVYSVCPQHKGECLSANNNKGLIALTVVSEAKDKGEEFSALSLPQLFNLLKTEDGKRFESCIRRICNTVHLHDPALLYTPI